MTTTPPFSTGFPADADPLRPRAAAGPDWARRVRPIERKRRDLHVTGAWPGWVYRDGTRTSFRLDGIDVSADDLNAALAVGRPLRSRHVRRVRAHLAILRSLDRCRRQSRCVSVDGVLRWYTGISGGLSTVPPSQSTRERLTSVVRRVGSPQRRLQPAVTEAARVYAELLADPLFPGFNGILARLLLHAHLTACGLPPVVFDPARDAWPDPTPAVVTACLLERLEVTLDRLGATAA